MHIFVTPNDLLLDTWREAFPDAVLRRKNAWQEPPGRQCCYWLRLREDESVAGQVTRMRALAGNIPVVVLDDQPSDDVAIMAFEAGASGYINTHAQAEVLQGVAETVAHQGLWVGTSLMRRLLSAVASSPPPPVDAEPAWRQILSPREIEVALAVAAGGTNKEIARQMRITERTVKAHVSSVLDKLQLRDRLQLALLVNGRRSA